MFEDIVETAREPLLVLDSDPRVLLANRSFYDSFKVTPKETLGKLIYDLGNRQWDIPPFSTPSPARRMVTRISDTKGHRFTRRINCP